MPFSKEDKALNKN